jgi:hypothetical protein
LEVIILIKGEAGLEPNRSGLIKRCGHVFSKYQVSSCLGNFEGGGNDIWTLKGFELDSEVVLEQEVVTRASESIEGGSELGFDELVDLA